ncbi:hypothetical protein KY290_004050 [Solanum tuberosum]|uniref:Carbonyl reductase n=1 Tax=Solanum tuberosum TaxID=4113 RepID=A0ABQ7WUK9_SOLTU|nr:hypothetical protein KY284_004199 [Solanum tuberosum]KAH0733222.1 hypothetical protein KY289_004410 [Solanum tuberosum]KAH0784452.1 hypothetical protein KY290_004050 [Solanum tuberosum]
MAEASNFLATQRIAVVSGGNKGIGLEICRQLAAKGIVVILTARDEKKGNEAVNNMLKMDGHSNYNIIFHQLDVTDISSIVRLKDFIQDRFGKLDILQDLFIEKMNVATQTIDIGEECIKTNYYGAKWMIQELLPLLQLSDSPRIVNVSSIGGKLEKVGNEWAIGVLNDCDNLTEDKVDEVLNVFLKDFKEEGAQSPVWLALLRQGSPSGNYYIRKELSPF